MRRHRPSSQKHGAVWTVIALSAMAPTATPAQEQPDSVIVGFDFPRNQVLVPVYIGSRGPFHFILDSAVHPSVVDIAVAEAVGLPVDEESPFPAAGIGSERIEVYPSRLDGMRVGEMSLPAFDAVAMDLSPLRAALGRELHGALGYSFLATRAVRVDYPNRQVTIYDGRAPEPATAAALTLPLNLHGTTPLLTSVRLDGKELDAHLDTGASLALNVSARAASRLGLEELRGGGERSSVYGARGRASVLRVTADSLAIGSLSISAPEIALSSWDGGVDALLGNGFLRHFVLTIDYVAEVIRLEHPAGERSP